MNIKYFSFIVAGLLVISLTLSALWLTNRNPFARFLSQKGGFMSVSIADMSKGGVPNYRKSGLSVEQWQKLFDEALSRGAEPVDKRIITTVIKVDLMNGDKIMISYYGGSVWRFGEIWLKDNGQLRKVVDDEVARH